MIVTPGSTSQSVTLQIVDDSGLAVTGLTAATMPTISYERVAEALVGITLSDLAALTSAYSSGGVKEVGSGYYRLDCPDAAFATASRVRIIGEATGKHVLYPVITCAHLSGNLAQWLGTAPLALSGQQVQAVVPATQKVDVETIKTRAVTCASGVTFPASIGTSTYAGGAVASVTAGVTVTTNNDKTGYSLSAAGVQAIWDALTGAMTTVGSIGKKLADWVVGTLTAGERTSIANEVEAQIIDETDSEKVLTAITDKIASVNPSLAGLTLSAIAAQVRTNLAVELARIDTNVGSRYDGSLPGWYVSPPSAATVAAACAAQITTDHGTGSYLRNTEPPTTSQIWTGIITESYAAVGAPTTPAQALYSILANLTEESITDNTLTVYGRDGTTVVETYTLNDATSPTTRHRTS